jgi:hypothetical protein
MSALRVGRSGIDLGIGDAPSDQRQRNPGSTGCLGMPFVGLNFVQPLNGGKCSTPQQIKGFWRTIRSGLRAFFVDHRRIRFPRRKSLSEKSGKIGRILEPPFFPCRLFIADPVDEAGKRIGADPANCFCCLLFGRPGCQTHLTNYHLTVPLHPFDSYRRILVSGEPLTQLHPIVPRLPFA